MPQRHGKSVRDRRWIFPWIATWIFRGSCAAPWMMLRGWARWFVIHPRHGGGTGRFLMNPAASAFPLEGQGQLKAARFSTRGIVFDGLEASLALKPEGVVYVRNALLTHHSGEVRGQILWGPEEGRYELDWHMALDPALPFIPEGGIRQVLNRFTFDPQSRIGVTCRGTARRAKRHGGMPDDSICGILSIKIFL